eukprot:14701492-Alexandrium_andersonii.AAC.1
MRAVTSPCPESADLRSCGGPPAACSLGPLRVLAHHSGVAHVSVGASAAQPTAVLAGRAAVSG